VENHINKASSGDILKGGDFMSELMRNREYRQRILKELIKELHDGKGVDEVKERFAQVIEGISPTEISEMEQALMAEGMPVEEIQRLCDVHAAVFKGSIQEIHREADPKDEPGHPLNILQLENRELESLIEEKIKPHWEEFKRADEKANLDKLQADFATLWEIDKHYSRKENLLFPFLEKYGITAPPKVMWGVDDEIRDQIKEIRQELWDYQGNKAEIFTKAMEVLDRIKEMIYKEESILFPMALETLSEDEWLEIAQESDEIGYCLVEPREKWRPRRVDVEEKLRDQGKQPVAGGYVEFPTGVLLPQELIAILNKLPIDITFVDKDGIVKYFSQGPERIFARPKTVIGRKVENCHPPASLHVVEKLIADFISGEKDQEDFWLHLGDKYVLIRYFAVRNPEGEYLGTLEVTQNIKPLQSISGEKRLLDG
jgi:DUF438 domain-containing protein